MIVKIVAARGYLYALDSAGKLWQRSPWWHGSWSAAGGPSSRDGEPLPLIDVAVTFPYDADDDTSTLYVLTRDGHLYEQDFQTWLLVEPPT